MGNITDDRKALTDKIIENLKKDGLIWLREWRNSERPVNALNVDTKYKGANRVALTEAMISKGYRDPRWVTYLQAKNNGWQVKSGEKGVTCEHWRFTKKEKIKNEKGELEEVEVLLNKGIRSTFTLFNGEQIEGIDKYIPKEKLLADKYNYIITRLEGTSPCEVKYFPQDRAYYSPGQDHIIMPNKENFFSEESLLATLTHEMSHSTGHKNRLDRELEGIKNNEKYAREELVAELSSIFVEQGLNIEINDSHFENHSAYIQFWIKELEKDHNEIYKIAADAEKSADYILERYNDLSLNLKREKKECLFRDLKVEFEFSEHAFGIPDNTILRGKGAYLFLKDLIKADSDLSLSPGYYKTYFTLEYKGYKSNRQRVDLGDYLFKGNEYVHEGLRNYFKAGIEPMKNEDQIHWHMKVLNMTKEELVKAVDEHLMDIDMMCNQLGREEKKHEKEGKQAGKNKKEIEIEK